jgi:hypothetical protein
VLNGQTHVVEVVFSQLDPELLAIPHSHDRLTRHDVGKVDFELVPQNELVTVTDLKGHRDLVVRLCLVPALGADLHDGRPHALQIYRLWPVQRKT